MNIKKYKEKNTKEYREATTSKMYHVVVEVTITTFSNNDLNKHDMSISAVKNTTYPKCHLFFTFSHFNFKASLFLVSLL